MKHVAESYRELEKCVRAFARGSFKVLFVIGPPGQSKSTIVRRVMRRARFVKGGGLTAFQLYRELWYHQDEDFVLDDVEALYRDKSVVQLLKALCESEDVKTIQWTTAAAQLEKEGIEKEFETTSRVVIILNDWQELGQHIQSLEDRGLMVLFRPPVEEVIAMAKTFIGDVEVLEFVTANRAYIDSLSLRALSIAVEMKGQGMDWRRPLIESTGARLVILAKEVCEDDSLLGERAKLQAWSDRTGVNGRPGLGRCAFFTYKRRYEELKVRYEGRKNKGGCKAKKGA